MRLYYHPVSTTCRPILQFCADAQVKYEPVVVDLMTGEEQREPYISVNPNGMVPALVDGDWILTESSAILKYIAEKINSSAYPKDLKQRARVNELMDWFNTNFYRDYGYNLIYPQLFPHHARSSDEANRATIEWGREHAKTTLRILNDHYLSYNKKYLCGDGITIADYFGSALITLGDLTHTDLSGYPNIHRWIQNMKAMPSWNAANEVFNGFSESLKGKSFVTVNQ